MVFGDVFIFFACKVTKIRPNEKVMPQEISPWPVFAFINACVRDLFTLLILPLRCNL